MPDLIKHMAPQPDHAERYNTVTRLDMTSESVAFPAQIEAAVQSLSQTGAVILENVVPLHYLLQIRDWLANVPMLSPCHPHVHANGHMHTEPPTSAGYVWPAMLANKTIIDVVHTYIGAKLRMNYYGMNVNMPGSTHQPAHVDFCSSSASTAREVVINLPLVDTSAANGATELWLGTHRAPLNASGPLCKVPTEMLCEWNREPVQPTVSMGSALIRDIGLWHRGTPNHSERSRPMLALIYSAQSVRYPPGTAIRYQGASREDFVSDNFDMHAVFERSCANTSCAHHT